MPEIQSSHNQFSGTVHGPMVQAGAVYVSAALPPSPRNRFGRRLMGVASVLVIGLAVPASRPMISASVRSCAGVSLASSAEPAHLGQTGAYLWNGQLHLLAPNSDGRLRHWWQEPPRLARRFEGFLGMGIPDWPATLTADMQQHVFVRTTDGELWHTWWDDVDTRWFHDTWATDLSGDPTALADGPNQDVWAVTRGGELIRWWWNSADSRFRNELWGRQVAGRPGVALAGGNVHLVARLASGSIGYWRSDQGGAPRTAVFGAGVAGDPVVVVVDGAVQVWAVDRQSGLRHWSLAPDQSWREDLWGTGVTGRPSVVLDGGQPRVFTRSVTGVIERWTGPERTVIGDGARTDPATVGFLGQEHVFAIGEHDQVHHWWLAPGCGVQREDLVTPPGG